MGTVYRGRDLRRGDRVAVKVVRANSLELLKRLGREAEVLSELRHPCLVSFREWGALPDGGAFIAMEWIEGVELAQHLRPAPLGLSQALAMGLGLASALALGMSAAGSSRSAEEDVVSVVVALAAAAAFPSEGWGVSSFICRPSRNSRLSCSGLSLYLVASSLVVKVSAPSVLRVLPGEGITGMVSS